MIDILSDDEEDELSYKMPPPAAEQAREAPSDVPLGLAGQEEDLPPLHLSFPARVTKASRKFILSTTLPSRLVPRGAQPLQVIIHTASGRVVYEGLASLLASSATSSCSQDTASTNAKAQRGPDNRRGKGKELSKLLVLARS